MFRARSRPRGGRDVRFFWQVLLVVPPVVLLSAMAVCSLRQDRASIEQDARRNAGVLAADLARRVGDRLHDDVAAAARTPAPEALCGLILDGRIRLPVDYPALPSPPSWPHTLTDGEARAWRIAAAATPASDLAAVRRTVAGLARAPLPLQANAEWALLRAEAARGDSAQAGQRLAALAARYPDVPSESGTPLGDLALLLALRHAPAGGLPDALVRSLRTRMLERPSFMTPALVEEAERRAASDGAAAALAALWRTNERALDLLRRLPADDLRPGEIALESGSEVWLALVGLLAPASSPPAAGMPRTAFHVTLVPAPLIDRAFRAALSVVADQVPGYNSVHLRLGDRVWRAGGTAPAGVRFDELASVAGRLEIPLLVPADAVPTFREDLLRAVPGALRSVPTLADGPVELAASPVGHAFAVGVDLAAPDALYASYRRRFWLAMGLILTATVAAFAGLASTWQAFQRQRRLNEMKSNFVASVSHELRAPIAAVTLMTESLERGTIEDGNRRQEYLRTIVQECRRLSSLVDNVLDFSRIDQGRARYTFEPADVHALVAQTVDLMRAFGAQRQIGLVHAPPQDGDARLQLEVDRQAIQQALVNLIDNAIKHSPAGAEVTVGVEGGRDQVRLFVEDHGPGIPADEQERIFEPFYRRGSELRRETRGIGIGLSIVKHVAEAHGGRIVVASSPGSGSRFAIELPFSREPEP